MEPGTAEVNDRQRGLTAGDDEAGERLDRALARLWPDLSRSRLQGMIGSGAVRVNGQAIRPSYRLSPGDAVEAEVPEPVALDAVAENLPLEIVYEDDDLLVVDKPAGMTVHPAPGSRSGTLVNALLHHCSALSGINGVLRPGIIHRLDRDTTGLLVVAKGDAAHRGLASQIEARQMRRQYVAVVWGTTDDSGTVDAPLGRNPRDRVKMAVVSRGRRAVTHYRTAERLPFLSRLDVRLETGRTHQIRVHLQHLGHPVFGDPAYGGRSGVRGIEPAHRPLASELLQHLDRQALHAGQLGFVHPRTGAEMTLESPLPPDLSGLLERARPASA